MRGGLGTRCGVPMQKSVVFLDITELNVVFYKIYCSLGLEFFSKWCYFLSFHWSVKNISSGFYRLLGGKS